MSFTGIKFTSRFVVLAIGVDFVAWLLVEALVISGVLMVVVEKLETEDAFGLAGAVEVNVVTANSSKVNWLNNIAMYTTNNQPIFNVDSYKT